MKSKWIWVETSWDESSRVFGLFGTKRPGTKRPWRETSRYGLEYLGHGLNFVMRAQIQQLNSSFMDWIIIFDH